MEAETEFNCPRALTDLTGLHTGKPKEMLCISSGESKSHKKRTRMMGCVLALRLHIMRKKVSVNCSLAKFLSSKMQLCRFHLHFLMAWEHPHRTLLWFLFCVEGKREWWGIREHAVCSCGQIWLCITAVEDYSGLLPKPSEVKVGLSASIGFGSVISRGFSYAGYFVLPLKNVLSRSQHSFLTLSWFARMCCS